MNKGFTLIELLTVIIIIGLLLVLAIPTYFSVFSSIKRNTLSSKITEIETVALEKASKTKDEIKKQKCINYTIEDLIKDGSISSDEKNRDVIINPTTNQALNGVVFVCYDKEKLDIVANYTIPYEKNHIYYKDEKVNVGNKIYKCLENINTRNYSIENLHQFSLIYNGE